MNKLQSFFINGGSGETKIPSDGVLMPCTMKQLATIEIVKSPLPQGMTMTLERTQEFLDTSTPLAVERSILLQLHHAIRQLEGSSYVKGDSYDEPPGVFTSKQIGRKRAPLSADSIIDVIYTLDVRYRRSAAFLCAPDALQHLGQLTDGRGQHLYRKDPDLLVGYRCYTDPDVPENQIMFGDFRQGYLIQGHCCLKVLRQPSPKEPKVLFHVNHEMDGRVNNSEALKILEYTHGYEH